MIIEWDIEIYKSLDKIQKDPYKRKPLSNKHENNFSLRVRNYRIILSSCWKLNKDIRYRFPR
jgi:mRNA-degrading endonuclease RelE of RelBE toxin-antitoxin system